MQSVPLKLLLLSIEFPPGPGGIGTLAYQIANNLSRSGCKVVVACHQAHVSSNEEILQFNKTQAFEVVNFPRRIFFIWEVIERFLITLRVFLRFQPSLILTFGRQVGWLGGIISLLYKIPVVPFGIGTEFLVRNHFDLWLTRQFYSKVPFVIFISRFSQALAERQGFVIKKSKIIHPVADNNAFQPNLDIRKLRSQLGFNGEKILLTVGQVSTRKAQDIVIRALPKILKHYPNTHYLIVGLPYQQTTFQELANQVGVSDHVHFLGRIEPNQLAKYYNIADIFVLVSRQTQQGDVEGFGIVAVEAALCGKPCVVSDETGLVEAVLPGKTALVVPQEDPDATSDAILKLLENHQLLIDMGNEARKWATVNNSWERQSKELLSTLRNVLGRN